MNRALHEREKQNKTKNKKANEQKNTLRSSGGIQVETE